MPSTETQMRQRSRAMHAAGSDFCCRAGTGRHRQEQRQSRSASGGERIPETHRHWANIEVLQSKYLNTILEQDDHFIKLIAVPTLGINPTELDQG
ncbi:hypothetical protein [Paracoccus sp. XHP0099]|uniref:Uncharacterized protein n=1 Tax=Paracoccus marinaquae TaxID=2841926 RepID=A0ABS6AP21_9RHOB|nr:hypothetical protein [Paracoccus marinaquae]